MTSYEIARRVSVVGLWVNIGLTTIKILVGFIARSEALIADGLHSGSDILATGVVYLSLFYANRPKDSDHPYGHGKIEQLAAVFVALTLFTIVGVLLYNVVKSLYEFFILKHALIAPSALAIAGAILSIIVKEWLFRYTYKAGKKVNSPAVIASAWDHRSDAYSSIGVLIGIIGAVLGYPVLDPLAALTVAGFIIHVAYKIAKEAADDLMDKAIPSTVVDGIKDFLLKEPDIAMIDGIQGRRMGSKYILDIGVSVPTFYSLKHTHNITHAIEERLLNNFQDLAQVNLHIHAISADEEKIRRFNILEGILVESLSEELSFHKLNYNYTSEDESISLHLLFHRDISLFKAHEIATALEKRLVETFPKAIVTIHMEPELTP